jgi:hypothetical protein
MNNARDRLAIDSIDMHVQYRSVCDKRSSNDLRVCEM